MALNVLGILIVSEVVSGLQPVRVVTSQLFNHHKPPPGQRHPECPQRLTLSIERLEALESDNPGTVTWAKPSAEPTHENSAEARRAALDAILRIHDEEYVEYVEEMSKGGGGGLDQDTYIAPLSFEAAVLAQSAWLDAVDYTLSTGSPSFALVRPPGHHALKARGMGFCSFNFCAAAAKHALESGEVERVAIFDWDVHHGNGVAALVEDDPRIRYCSIHEEGNFPNTGRADDTGNSGHGNLLHVPLQAGSGWTQYEAALSSAVLPWLAEFSPDLVLVSAGFDALGLDPLARQELTAADFGAMSRMLRKGLQGTPAVGSSGGAGGVATTSGGEEGGAQGGQRCKVVLGLEGGYSLEPMGLAEAVAQTVMAFAEEGGEGLGSGAASAAAWAGTAAGNAPPPPSAGPMTAEVRHLRALAFREFEFGSAARLVWKGLMGKREFVLSRFHRRAHLRRTMRGG